MHHVASVVSANENTKYCLKNIYLKTIINAPYCVSSANENTPEWAPLQTSGRTDKWAPLNIKIFENNK